jgi:hypothetical protein
MMIPVQVMALMVAGLDPWQLYRMPSWQSTTCNAKHHAQYGNYEPVMTKLTDIHADDAFAPHECAPVFQRQQADFSSSIAQCAS